MVGRLCRREQRSPWRQALRQRGQGRQGGRARHVMWGRGSISGHGKHRTLLNDIRIGSGGAGPIPAASAGPASPDLEVEGAIHPILLRAEDARQVVCHPVVVLLSSRTLQQWQRGGGQQAAVGGGGQAAAAAWQQRGWCAASRRLDFKHSSPCAPQPAGAAPSGLGRPLEGNQGASSPSSTHRASAKCPGMRAHAGWRTPAAMGRPQPRNVQRRSQVPCPLTLQALKRVRSTVS